MTGELGALEDAVRKARKNPFLPMERILGDPFIDDGYGEDESAPARDFNGARDAEREAQLVEDLAALNARLLKERAFETRSGNGQIEAGARLVSGLSQPVRAQAGLLPGRQRRDHGADRRRRRQGARDRRQAGHVAVARRRGLLAAGHPGGSAADLGRCRPRRRRCWPKRGRRGAPTTAPRHRPSCNSAGLPRCSTPTWRRSWTSSARATSRCSPAICSEASELDEAAQETTEAEIRQARRGLVHRA